MDTFSDSEDDDTSILVYARNSSNSFLEHILSSKMTLKQRHLLFGYVREMEQLLRAPVPDAIVYVLCAFYFVFNDEWNRFLSSSDFLFIGHKIIRNIKGGHWSIAAFGWRVDDEMCDQLSIEFKWKTPRCRKGIRLG